MLAWRRWAPRPYPLADAAGRILGDAVTAGHAVPPFDLTLMNEYVARGEETLLGRQASYREAASVTDYGIMASALNECLNRLSRDLALDLMGLEGEAGTAMLLN